VFTVEALRFFARTGSVWPKISGTMGRPQPAILPVRKLDEWIFYMV